MLGTHGQSGRGELIPDSKGKATAVVESVRVGAVVTGAHPAKHRMRRACPLPALAPLLQVTGTATEQSARACNIHPT